MMLTAYTVCFVAGALGIALSMLGFGDPGLAAGSEIEEAARTGKAALSRSLDLRGLTIGATFFGLTGALFTLLRVGPFLTLALASAWAAVAAGSTLRLTAYLAGGESTPDHPLTEVDGDRRRWPLDPTEVDRDRRRWRVDLTEVDGDRSRWRSR